MNKAEQYHHNQVRSLGCVICREFDGEKTPAQIHHIGEGSGLRSEFMIVPLCQYHHTGSAGLHGMGIKAFLRLYKLPTEYHLIELVNKYLSIEKC